MAGKRSYLRAAVISLLYLCAVCVSPVHALLGPTIYVDADATGPTHDGSAWCDAYLELYEALAVATAGTTIRVANGTYKPGTLDLTDPREATFELPTGVAVEGGYAGCDATDPDERDIEFFETFLSGDLAGDDTTGDGSGSNCCSGHAGTGCDNEECQTTVCAVLPMCCSSGWNTTCVIEATARCCNLCTTTMNCENSYHVVTASGTDDTTVLDGVTITAGHARGLFGSTDPTAFGGGLYYTDGSPTVVDCTFLENAAGWGGAVAGETAFATATYLRCKFLGNSADIGGAMANINASSTIINSLYSGNEAVIDGGAVFNDLSTVTLINCTLANNRATMAGGIRNYAAVNLFLTNCILWGNLANGLGGEAAQIISSSSTVAVNYTCVEGWSGAFGGVGNTGDDPEFVDPEGSDGKTGTKDDNLRLLGGSPAINAGDNNAVPPSVTTDLDGNPRIAHGTVDMGAYEYQGDSIIPAASWWGLIVMALLVLSGGTVAVMRQREAA